MNSEQSFNKGNRAIEWKAALSYPKAASSKCPLLEAVTIIGRAKFGTEWSGNELHATYWLEQPKEVERLRMARGVSKAPPPIRTLRDQMREAEPKRVGFDLGAYEDAAKARQEKVANEQALWERNSGDLRRLRFAVDWLAQQCRDNALQSYYRFESGGNLAPLTAGDWNVDDPLAKFAERGGYEKWFVAQQPPRKLFVYIFFEREEIEQAAAIFANAHPAISAIDLSTVSPYLRFAVQMALGFGWTSVDGASTKDYREAKIREAWATAFPDVPYTKGQAQMLAGVTGFPNIEGIKNGMIATTRRKNRSAPKTAGK